MANKRPAETIDFDGEAAMLKDENFNRVLEAQAAVITANFMKKAMQILRPIEISQAALVAYFEKKQAQNVVADCKPPAAKKQRSASPPKSKQPPDDDAVEAMESELSAAAQLCEKEVARINQLKKKELIAELNAHGENDFNPRALKSTLAELLMSTIADKQKNYAETQLREYGNFDRVQPMVLESAAETNEAQPESGSKQTTDTADDEDEDMKPAAKEEPPKGVVKNAVAVAEKRVAVGADGGRMEVVSPQPKKLVETPGTPVEKVSGTVSSPIVVDNIASTSDDNDDDDDDEDFTTASQGMGSSQLESKAFAVTKKHEPKLETIPGSVLKGSPPSPSPSRSPLQSIVQPGTVLSTKKLFEPKPASNTEAMFSPPRPAKSPLFLSTDRSEQVVKEVSESDTSKKSTSLESYEDIKPPAVDKTSSKTGGLLSYEDIKPPAVDTTSSKTGGLLLATPALSASKTGSSALKSTAAVKRAEERATNIKEKMRLMTKQKRCNISASKKTTKLPGTSSLLRAAQVPLASDHSGETGSGKKKTTDKKKILDKMRAKAFQRSPVPQVASLPKKNDEDNYEMSDDEEDSDDEASRSEKPIPRWAKTGKLIPALEKQYAAHYPLDPDVLFGEVYTCDLEAIFPERKNMNFKSRGSSGDWKKDGVTEKEKRRYKKQLKMMS